MYSYDRRATNEKIPGTRDVAERMVRAENEFIETLMQFGKISKQDAIKVYNLYKKLKVIKRHGLGGNIGVKHGQFLDREVILRALAQAS
jgi:hypothetical protein